MSEQTCDCCGTVEDRPADVAGEVEPSTDRWLGDAAAMETPLPDDVRTAMEGFFGDASIETLEDWVAELRERTGGGSIDAEDLCHADGETAHWGELDGTRHHFRCFYDAVVLAELASEPIEIHTESPSGDVIEARATGDGELTATPSTAAVSFGVVTDDAALPAAEATLEDAYGAICPAVRAFPTRDAHEGWAAEANAATVGMPLSIATGVAIGLVGE
ncbi:organomercurial lyase [Natrinema sp. 1APR25-10V2]|uniref:organomercurial lyase n=1 Tax=Natrinema sp. 1APR25-10V2 TaxID=2951081 RepID=UPI0028746DC7|nr:organomercurial lyase [Natrinema sp. 1APR25-10V2]MDS0476113.1 alkylmercury lyase family protein [Natrinema sp. 1APR25-10V2]